MRNVGSLPRITRTAPITRPCTVGNTAGIQRLAASVFISFVIDPLRNIVASDPLTLMRPRVDDRSTSPAPPPRTASYSVIVFTCVIRGWPLPPPDNPSSDPSRVDAMRALAGSDDKSARARGCSTSVFDQPTFSNSTHEIEYASMPRAQLSPTSRSRADRRDRSCAVRSPNSLRVLFASACDLLLIQSAGYTGRRW